MYLLGKNADLLSIEIPAVVADPGLGIAAVAQTVRWSGICDAWIDEDVVHEIRGQMRVTVSETLVDLPVNLPVWPQLEDILVLRRIDAIGNAQVAQPQSPNEEPARQYLRVRFIDGGVTLLGKFRCKCVRS